MRSWLPLLLVAGCAGGRHTDDDTDTPDDGTFRVVVLADPHVIGDDYRCCESPGLDTESIGRTRRRLEVARDLINDLDRQPDLGFVLGDVFHQNYAYERLEDYADPARGSAAYHARRILGGFRAPMHLLWGNHDYSVPEFSREFAHELFREMFDTPPYHAVDHRGWRFLATNSQLGPSWDAETPMDAFIEMGTGWGSFGREQLAWMAEQLDEGKPTFLMFHHPPVRILTVEDPDGPIPDVFALIERYRDRIAGVLVGHMHRWIDLTNVLDLPAYVVGSIRYDADNFWLLELDANGTDYRIVDRDKAFWGSTWAYGTTYDGDDARIDFEEDAEEDPAGPWDGWSPPWER